MPLRLTTERLLLRRWCASDRDPFVAMHDDPDVQATLGPPRSGADYDALVDRIEAEFGERGFGLWALERRDTGEFIGFTGLTGFATRDTPAEGQVEIGWRLARAHWGFGFATEAARRVINDGFTRCGLTEVVSLTAVINTRSRAVMERLGMMHDPTLDFLHPRVGEDDPLRPSVVYRLRRDDWSAANRGGAPHRG